MAWTRVSGALAAGLVAATALILPARAETLADAIALAYQSNPTLQSQRAQLRQLDENYVQARAGYRPTLGATVQSQYTKIQNSPSQRQGSFFSAGGSFNESNSTSATLSLSQPLYTGGRVRSAISAAEADILAGREALRGSENQILLQVVQAYEDVRRDQQFVTIRADSVGVLSRQLEEIQARFQAGQVTRTDVAQAQARLAQARADLTSAQGQLQVSRAAYAAVVGQNPGELSPPSRLPGLPRTIDEAFDRADRDSPALLRAEFNEQASRFRISEAKAARRPEVTASATFGYVGPLARIGPTAGLDRFNQEFQATATVSQPLYQGGVISSRIRAATEQNNSDRILIESARRQAVQQVSQAWNQIVSARQNVTAQEEQVRAAAIAAEGTREEYRVGLRTTLDVLFAEETLRSAQLSLVQARHDAFVSEANLLNAMGALEARTLLTNAPLYDPAKNFRKVENAGGTPWDGAVAALDGLGAPKLAPRKPLSAPRADPAPETPAPTEVLPPADAPLVTAVPTTPIRGSVAPNTPVTQGANPGAANPLPPRPPLERKDLSRSEPH